MQSFTHQEIARMRYAEVLREAPRRHRPVEDLPVEAPTKTPTLFSSLLSRLASPKQVALHAVRAR